jgi:hypothetical protein
MVLSWSEWQNRFSGDTGVVGRAIQLNGQPFTVIGVAERGFRGHSGLFDAVLFVPLTLNSVVTGQPNIDSRNSVWLEMVGRLAPGVSLEQAEAGLTARYAAMMRDNGLTWTRGLDLRRWAAVPAFAVGPVTGFMGVLLVLASLILLIASANVANVLLARLPRVPAKSRCGSRSGPAARAWCGSSSPRASCSSWLAARAAR